MNCKLPRFTLAKGAEAETEAETEGEKRTETEAQAEAQRKRRRKRKQKFFKSGRTSQSHSSFPVPPTRTFGKKAWRRSARHGQGGRAKIQAEAVRKFLVLYDKTCNEFKDRDKKHAWHNVGKELGLNSGTY